MTLAASRSVEQRPAISVLPAAPAPSHVDEANHRIANNLQLVVAMIAVEAHRVGDPTASEILEVTQRRITAIAMIHRLLYQTRGSTIVDLGDYLRELGDSLEQSCGDAASGRRVLVHTAAVAASADDAASIAIIVSETIANACKYAYPIGVAGDVVVELRHMPFGGYRLTVTDRGCGIPDGAPLRGDGLGSQLIGMFAKRLGANHGWDDARPGTRFHLSVGLR